MTKQKVNICIKGLRRLYMHYEQSTKFQPTQCHNSCSMEASGSTGDSQFQHRLRSNTEEAQIKISPSPRLNKIS